MASLRVLIGETDPAIASVVELILQDEGHEVRLTGTILELEREAGARPWDVIVTDLVARSAIQLDPRDGAMLRSLSSRAPVILTTAWLWAVGARPEDLGVAVVLPKPFELEELLDAIRRATGGSL